MSIALAFFLFAGGYLLAKSSAGADYYISTEREPDERVVAAFAPIYDGDRIDLNTATIDELMEIPNIGETRAQAIIAYREEQGSFESIADIMEVSGIGEGIYEQVKDYICVTKDD